MDHADNPNYGTARPYKTKFICVDCRKSFKRKLLSDISNLSDEGEKDPKCPDCGKLTTYIGPKFRSPGKENIQAWKSIEILRDLGLLDFIGWSNNLIYIPGSQKKLEVFIRELKVRYLAYIHKRASGTYSPDDKDMIKHFADKIGIMDQFLNGKKNNS